MAEPDGTESLPRANESAPENVAPDRPRILIVDDEPQITRVLRASLMSRGYQIRVAADGEAGMDTFLDWHPDMIISDLSMPNMDGIELCRRVRRQSDIPIVILSVRDQEGAKIEALDAGADGYITKPFSIDELLARVRALLRKVPFWSKTQETARNGERIVREGDFAVDQDLRTVSVRGKNIHLTPKEYDLLLYLLRNANQVLKHKFVLDAVWGENAIQQNEYLHVFIRQLRKKIEPDPTAPRYILTEPWVGYRFNPGGE